MELAHPMTSGMSGPIAMGVPVSVRTAKGDARCETTPLNLKTALH